MRRFSQVGIGVHVCNVTARGGPGTHYYNARMDLLDAVTVFSLLGVAAVNLMQIIERRRQHR